METGELVVALVALAFGAWAGVVAWLGNGIRSDLRTIARELDQQTDKMNSYIIQTEKRLAVLEDRVHNARHTAPTIVNPT
jgi:hypothetical protein